MSYKRLLLVLLLIASSASASECLYQRCFVGIEFDRQNFKAKKEISIAEGIPKVHSTFMKSWNSGYAINAGYRFHTIAYRFGYTKSDTVDYYPTLYAAVDGSQLATGFLRQKSSNIFIDGFYYFKYAKRSELKFMLGAGYLRTKIDSTLYGNRAGYYFSEANGPGLRVGIGSQYQINSCFVADIIAKVQFPANDIFRYAAAISIGLAYYI